MHSAAEGHHLLLGAIPPCLGTPRCLVLRAICASNALSLLLPSLGDSNPQCSPGRRCRGPSLEHLICHPMPPRRAVLGCFSLHAIQVWPACPTTCHQPSWGLGLSHRPSASCTGSESGLDSSTGPFFPRRHLFPSLSISTPKVSKAAHAHLCTPSVPVPLLCKQLYVPSCAPQSQEPPCSGDGDISYEHRARSTWDFLGLWDSGVNQAPTSPQHWGEHQKRGLSHFPLHLLPLSPKLPPLQVTAGDGDAGAGCSINLYSTHWALGTNLSMVLGHQTIQKVSAMAVVAESPWGQCGRHHPCSPKESGWSW